MKSSALLFDEFDIKEQSTTDYLKKGKRAFNSNVIFDVSLKKNTLSGIYRRGKVERHVKIYRDSSNQLIGTINGVETHPFTSPLTALAYWYIQFAHEHHPNDIYSKADQNNLEPFDQIQLTLIQNPEKNTLSLTFFQPKTQTYCQDSHLFIYHFSQLTKGFSRDVQNILNTLQQHYSDAFFCEQTFVKTDSFLFNHLMLLIQKDHLYNHRHKKITPYASPVTLKVSCRIANHDILTSFEWVSANQKKSFSIHDCIQYDRKEWVIFNEHCYKIQSMMHAKIAKPFQSNRVKRLNISKVKSFLAKMMELKKTIHIQLQIDADIQKLRPTDTQPVCVVDVELTDSGGRLILFYIYNQIQVQSSDTFSYIIFDDMTYCIRDQATEHQFRDTLLHYHPCKTTENTIEYARPYFDHILGLLKHKQLENIRLSPQATRTIKPLKQSITASIQFKADPSKMLSFQIRWKHPSSNRDFMDLKTHLHHNIPYYFDSSAKTIIPIDNHDLLDELSDKHTPLLPIGAAIYLALHTHTQITLPNHVQKMVDLLKKPSAISLLPSSKALRPFQKTGLQWLLTLYQSNFSGILADDMGLGKTIQTIFLLKHVYQKSPKPCLVVMPKTLLFNWKKELDTFSPELKILLYDGPKRSFLLDDFTSADVILASYTSIRIDIRKITQSFQFLILDEAQYVKNHTTNTFKAIKKIKSDHRILLSGTPIENNIGDLWSLMDIANPDYFGSFKSFDQWYGQGEHQALLKASIHPFLLRRHKKDVLNDLPPISIQELWASPSPVERKQYDQFAKEEWGRIETMVSEKGVAQSKMHIFSLMTKLRQWCAHPSFIYPESDHGPKFNVFLERLEEAISGGHKVVIFSQFIAMIQKMTSILTEKQISHVCLTGKTENREAVVHSFNTSDSIQVGIFSLKAGGVGINLTSADYVFIYDPWWNPAVEQQAIDRVHRMGQDQPVMVFKFLVASTIEERMLIYQEKKAALIESLIDDQSVDALNLEDIKHLIGVS